MKSVKMVKAYKDAEGIPTIEFDVMMKSVHDLKGRFTVGFMLIGRNNPKLAIFDDDRNILGVFDSKETAIKFIDNVIEKEMIRDRITYRYPVTKERSGYLVSTPSMITLDRKINQEHLKQFIVSKKVLQDGKIPKEKIQKWRFENNNISGE